MQIPDAFKCSQQTLKTFLSKLMMASSVLVSILFLIAVIYKKTSSQGFENVTDNRIQTTQASFISTTFPHNDLIKRLSRTRRQQPGSGCVIPRSMLNGTYSLRGNMILKEGELAPHNSILQLTCPPGYIPSNSAFNFCDDMKNDWFEELPKCEKMCKPPKSLTVEFSCTTPSKNGQAIRGSCGSSLPPGTAATPRCRNGHHSITSNRKIFCIDGRWEFSMPSCTAECGKTTPHGSPNVINGTNANIGEFPWHVAVYKIIANNPTLVCGGSIVSRTLVISAAHCFYDPLSRTSFGSDIFSIAVGKIFSNFSHPEETMNPFIQKSAIERIEIPEDYQGEASSFSHDLALLVLQTPLTFSNLIMPICINLVDKDFDEEQTTPGLNATVAGFGLVDVNGPPSDVLKTAVLPIVTKIKCREESPPEFSKYIISDKICAGYLTGIGTCKGDSGSGLVVSSLERKHLTWYLRGIVSTSPTSEYYDQCSTNTYSTFTKIFFHKEFIEEVIYKQGCTMPDNPPNGHFKLIGVKNANPGEGVGHKSQLVLTCNEGYVPSERRNNVCDEFINDWVQDFATCEMVSVIAATSPIKKGCVVPNNPQNGEFVFLMGTSDTHPGDIVPPFTIVSLKCSTGYSADSELNFCDGNNWASNLGTCEKMCDSLVSLSVQFNCSIPGKEGKQTSILGCDKPVPSGSIATPYCEDGHFSSERLPTLVCKDGFWDRPTPACTAICGKSITDSSDPLRRRKRETRKYALKGEFPWHVAIYRYTQTLESIRYICGGNILTRRHVVSNAHCFDDYGEKFEYIVAVGKIHPDFQNIEESIDTYIQKIKVKKAEIPVTYFGERKPAFDIGILILETPIIFSRFVMPICLDLQDALFNNGFEDGDLARTSGFGFEAPEGPQAPQLKAFTIPIYDKPTCKQIFKPGVQNFLGVDKICAGVINGTNLCKGDSGSGLAVSRKSKDGETLWYVLAIASSVQADEDNLCEIRSPAIFTKLFEHKYFIESVLNAPY